MKTNFIEWLQAELDNRGWTQADLANRTKVAAGSISRIMTGARNPGPDFCKSVAKALDIPQETVFRAAGLLDPLPEDHPELAEWEHIFRQAETEEERQRLLELARFELDRIRKIKDVGKPKK